MNVQPFLNSLARLFETVGSHVSKKVLSPVIDLISYIAKQIFPTSYSSAYSKEQSKKISLETQYAATVARIATLQQRLTDIEATTKATIQSVKEQSVYNPVDGEKRESCTREKQQIEQELAYAQRGLLTIKKYLKTVQEDSLSYEQEERSNEKERAEHSLKELEIKQQQLTDAIAVLDKEIHELISEMSSLQDALAGIEATEEFVPVEGVDTNKTKAHIQKYKETILKKKNKRRMLLSEWVSHNEKIRLEKNAISLMDRSLQNEDLLQ